jgi:hypothetical protein
MISREASPRDFLGILKVAVISGGAWAQFETQILTNLPQNADPANLSLLPTCGTKFLQFKGNWIELYSEDLTAEQRKKIIDSLDKAAGEAGYREKKVSGDVIEDRGSQITFSAPGQQAPLSEKEKWDPDFAKRKKITATLENLIPEFSIRMGGATSIDTTKPGIDKAYGIGKLRDTLPFPSLRWSTSAMRCSRAGTITPWSRLASCRFPSKDLTKPTLPAWAASELNR